MEWRQSVIYKDKAYAAIFDPKDAELVQKYMDFIRRNEYLVENLYDKLDRYHNDQTVTLYDKPFEPIDFFKGGNKLVNEGLIALAEFQVGKRTRQFTYYVIGDDNTSVSPTDDHLYGECARAHIPASGGTFVQRQSTIYYSLFFSKTIPDCKVAETGIVDTSSQSTDRMLLRTVLPDADVMNHKKNFDSIFVGHVIYSGSV